MGMVWVVLTEFGVYGVYDSEMTAESVAWTIKPKFMKVTIAPEHVRSL